MSRRGWVLFAAMGVIWGIPYLLIKVADGGVSVPVLVCTRVALGSALLLPVAIRGGHLRALRGHVRWLAAFTAVEIVGPFAALSTAERRLPSSTSGLLVAAVPIFSALLAIVFRSGDRLTPVRWAGLAIGLGGVAVLAGPGAGRGDALPVALVLLTALGYSIGPLIANRKLAALPPVAVNAACLGAAAVVYAPAAALTWPRSVPSPQVLAALAALGVVCTAAAFLVFFRLIAEVGPARATVITYVNPAVAVALGVIVLGEHLTAAIGVSFVLILGGSVLATRAGSAGSRTGDAASPPSPAAAVAGEPATPARCDK
ncbi:MAG: EamA family transporter [Streptosporangiaceae bacterium]|nr:EamA family transporter [Streptosporangiaceae bacterium]